MTNEQQPGRNWAVAIVHGIGDTKQLEMLEEISNAVQVQRPELVLEEHVRVVLATKPPATGSQSTENGSTVCQHVRDGHIGKSKVRFATAFWSDISSFGDGLVQLIGSLALGGMGVRYFADVGSSGRNLFANLLHATLMAKIALLAVGFLPIVLCTLFFSLYAFIGYYIFRYSLFVLQAWAIAGLSMLTIWYVSRLARRMLRPMRDQRTLAMPIFWALLIYGAVMTAIFILGHPRALGWLLPAWDGELCPQYSKPASSPKPNLIEGAVRWLLMAYGTASKNINWQDRVCLVDETGVYIALLQLAQYMCGFFVIILTALVLVLLAITHFPGVATRSERRGMRLGAVGATTMWLLMLFVLWPENVLTNGTLNRYMPSFKTDPFPLAHLSGFFIEDVLVKAGAGHKTEALKEMIPLIWFDVLFSGLLIWIMILSLMMIRRRRSWIEALAGAGTDRLSRFKPPLPRGDHWGPRIILSNAYQTTALVFMIVIAATALAHWIAGQYPAEPMFKPIEAIPHELFMQLSHVTMIVAVGLLLFLTGTQQIKQAMKLALDVVNHFAAPAKNFPIREQIARRFQATIDTLLEPKDKPHLVVICHSQGTVITLDQLFGYQRYVYERAWYGRRRITKWTRGLWETRLKDEVASLTILTFGSPATHLYHHYFATLYPTLDQFPGIQALEKDRLSGRVRWFNAYRIDDFVGTFIEQSVPGFPVNLPMKVGGHTRYWEAEILQPVFKEAGLQRILVEIP